MAPVYDTTSFRLGDIPYGGGYTKKAKLPTVPLMMEFSQFCRGLRTPAPKGNELDYYATPDFKLCVQQTVCISKLFWIQYANGSKGNGRH